MKLRELICVFLLLILGSAGTAAAQDVLVRAKALYTAAAYDDALKMLDTAEGAAPPPEVKQYRALCLLALGRTAEAEHELAAVVQADPLFMPDGEDVAPRVVSMFEDVRRQLLPAIIRSTFIEAKRLFQDNEKDRSRQQFERVLRLIEDPVMSGNGDLADLKLVVNGFVDLSRSAAPAPAAPAPSPATTMAAPPATPSSAPAAWTAAATPVIPPVAIQQSVPEWRPRDRLAMYREFSGAVRVLIDESGKVTSARMERPIHPEYDAMLLASAQKWLYKPALRNGVTITSEKVVEVRLRTRAPLDTPAASK